MYVFPNVCLSVHDPYTPPQNSIKWPVYRKIPAGTRRTHGQAPEHLKFHVIHQMHT